MAMFDSIFNKGFKAAKWYCLFILFDFLYIIWGLIFLLAIVYFVCFEMNLIAEFNTVHQLALLNYLGWFVLNFPFSLFAKLLGVFLVQLFIYEL